MKAVSSCPSGPVLQQLILGELDGPESDTLETHLQTCLDCRQVLDCLSDSDLLDEWRAVREKNDGSFPFLDLPVRTGDLGSVDQYAIESVLGRGGSGVVFRATDMELGRPVALKVLAFDLHHRATERFLRESRSAARMAGDHVVTVFATGTTTDNRPYLVMPLIEGESLRSQLQREMPDPLESARIIRDAALGLATIHESGTIHRDVKPANILIDANDGRARLTDFGLARATGDETLTQASVLCGTPEYMSPEQASDSRSHDQRGDIYSLGITLYECLTGTPPFRGLPLQVLEQHLQTAPIPPRRLQPSIPADLQNICLKAIAREPSHRYQTAIEFADDLKRLLSGSPVRAREISGPERIWRWCKRNRGLAGLAATSTGLLVLLGAGSAIAAWQLNATNRQLRMETQKADQAEQRAQTDRTIAVNALGNLVDSVYDDLTNDAASIRTRSHVANAAITGLRSLAETSGGQKADRTLFQAHLRIADLASLKGDHAEAELNYQSAIEVSRQLLDQTPDSIPAKLDLARAVGKLSMHYFQSVDPETAVQSADAAELFREVLAAIPDQQDAEVWLLALKVQRLEWERRTNPRDATSIFEQKEMLLADIDRILACEANGQMAWQVVSKAGFVIGRAYLESNQAELAALHFANARANLNQALERAPNNIRLQSEAAVIDRARGMAAGALGRLAEATSMFESALQTLEALSILDPQDLEQRTNVANTKSILAMAYQFSGRYDQAIHVLNGAIAIHREMAEANPINSSPGFMIVDTLLKRADMQLFANRWADAELTLREAAAELGLLSAADLPAGTLDFWNARVIQGSEVAARLAGQGPDRATPDGESLALFWLARLAASDSESMILSAEIKRRISKTGTEFSGENLDDLFAYARAIDGTTPLNSMLATVFETRVYGLLARNTQAFEGTDEEPVHAESLDRCLAAIRQLALDNPAGFSDMIMNDPDLIWVRNTAEFRAVCTEMGKFAIGDPNRTSN